MWNIPYLQRFISSLAAPEVVNISSGKKNFCVVGGTFDRLHIGHKTLINTALVNAKKILICVSSDRYVKALRKVAGDKIEPFEDRVKGVMQFIREIGANSKIKMCSLDDPYSPAIESRNARELDSIIVSEDQEILNRTLRLNELRKGANLAPLSILRIPLLRDPYGKVFSSTRYRLNDYFPEPRPPVFRLKKHLIAEIRKPKGDLISSPKELPPPEEFKNKGIIVIGDRAFINAVNARYPISVAIVDFRANRKDLSYSIVRVAKNQEHQEIVDVAPIIPTINDTGTISVFSWFSILVAYVQKVFSVVGVYGEEDLLGFPATILAPQGSLIIYGDPFLKKLVYFVVDDDYKEEAIGLLKKMQVQS